MNINLRRVLHPINISILQPEDYYQKCYLQTGGNTESSRVVVFEALVISVGETFERKNPLSPCHAQFYTS